MLSKSYTSSSSSSSSSADQVAKRAAEARAARLNRFSEKPEKPTADHSEYEQPSGSSEHSASESEDRAEKKLRQKKKLKPRRSSPSPSPRRTSYLESVIEKGRKRVREIEKEEEQNSGSEDKRRKRLSIQHVLEEEEEEETKRDNSKSSNSSSKKNKKAKETIEETEEEAEDVWPEIDLDVVSTHVKNVLAVVKQSSERDSIIIHPKYAVYLNPDVDGLTDDVLAECYNTDHVAYSNTRMSRFPCFSNGFCWTIDYRCVFTYTDLTQEHERYSVQERNLTTAHWLHEEKATSFAYQEFGFTSGVMYHAFPVAECPKIKKDMSEDELKEYTELTSREKERRKQMSVLWKVSEINRKKLKAKKTPCIHAQEHLAQDYEHPMLYPIRFGVDMFMKHEALPLKNKSRPQVLEWYWDSSNTYEFFWALITFRIMELLKEKSADHLVETWKAVEPIEEVMHLMQVAYDLIGIPHQGMCLNYIFDKFFQNDAEELLDRGLPDRLKVYYNKHKYEDGLVHDSQKEAMKKHFEVIRANLKKKDLIEKIKQAFVKPICVCRLAEKYPEKAVHREQYIAEYLRRAHPYPKLMDSTHISDFLDDDLLGKVEREVSFEGTLRKMKAKFPSVPDYRPASKFLKEEIFKCLSSGGPNRQGRQTFGTKGFHQCLFYMKVLDACPGLIPGFKRTKEESSANNIWLSVNLNNNRIGKECSASRTLLPCRPVTEVNATDLKMITRRWPRASSSSSSSSPPAVIAPTVAIDSSVPVENHSPCESASESGSEADSESEAEPESHKKKEKEEKEEEEERGKEEAGEEHEKYEGPSASSVSDHTSINWDIEVMIRQNTDCSKSVDCLNNTCPAINKWAFRIEPSHELGFPWCMAQLCYGPGGVIHSNDTESKRHAFMKDAEMQRYMIACHMVKKHYYRAEDRATALRYIDKTKNYQDENAVQYGRAEIQSASEIYDIGIAVYEISSDPECWKVPVRYYKYPGNNNPLWCFMLQQDTKFQLISCGEYLFFTTEQADQLFKANTRSGLSKMLKDIWTLAHSKASESSQTVHNLAVNLSPHLLPQNAPQSSSSSSDAPHLQLPAASEGPQLSPAPLDGPPSLQWGSMEQSVQQQQSQHSQLPLPALPGERPQSPASGSHSHLGDSFSRALESELEAHPIATPPILLVSEKVDKVLETVNRLSSIFHDSQTAIYNDLKGFLLEQEKKVHEATRTELESIKIKYSILQSEAITRDSISNDVINQMKQYTSALDLMIKKQNEAESKQRQLESLQQFLQQKVQSNAAESSSSSQSSKEEAATPIIPARTTRQRGRKA